MKNISTNANFSFVKIFNKTSKLRAMTSRKGGARVLYHSLEQNVKNICEKMDFSQFSNSKTKKTFQ